MIQEQDSKPFKVEISQDRLVDILMHAATREDIAKLGAKICEDIAKLGAKICEDIAKLDAKMEDQFAKMRQEFISIREDNKRLENKFEKMLWFIIVSILVPIAAHFFIK